MLSTYTFDLSLRMNLKMRHETKAPSTFSLGSQGRPIRGIPERMINLLAFSELIIWVNKFESLLRNKQLNTSNLNKIGVVSVIDTSLMSL